MDETYRIDNERTGPLIRLRLRARGDVLLALTVPIESGVYGYRRLSLYRLSRATRSIRKSLVSTFQFSDQGSWAFLNDRTLLLWDVDFSEPIAHRAPHRYIVRRFRITNRATLSWTGETKRRYGPDWDDYGINAFPVPPKDDPLREFGLAWRYWGQ